MSPSKKRSLSEGHRKAIAVDEEAEAAARERARPIVNDDNPLTERYEMLRDLPRTTIRKAWFAMAHVVPQPGQTIVDMGCRGGDMAFAMAALNPSCQIVGVDFDKDLIRNARQTYELPNLSFKIGDVGAPDLFKAESIDAIINSFILHEIYSGSQYNDRSVVQTLQNQFGLLKNDGIMYVRDFAMPSTGEYVLMEMPDVKSRGDTLEDLSEADLLVWFSEQARPHQDIGFAGFFLEELPPRFPKTRLFRLPAKWAYEFIMRKDERELWDAELPKEYTFFTEGEYTKTLRSLGGRVLYTAPHWDNTLIKARFDGHFRLYTEDGSPIGTPPTSFIAVTQKIRERHSMQLHERRASPNPNSSLHVHAMRNDIDGRIIDVLRRDVSMTEILPYRIAEDNELRVYVHVGIPRGIVNAVPRSSRQLDGKQWSGHMTEAISVQSELVSHIGEDNVKATLEFMRDDIGLKPVGGRALEIGPAFYPAPDFIDERIETRFIEVEQHEGAIDAGIIARHVTGFQAKGSIVEYAAQTLLNAIAVGIIPNAQLEMQILALYQKLGLKAETWVDSPLTLPEIDVKAADTRDLLIKLNDNDSRYVPTRGSAGQWRTLQSIFVEEGHLNGAITGLATQSLDFAISDESSENIAVVLPLVKNLSGEVLAGFVTDYLPVPQRHKGSGATITAPTLALPKHITSMEAARHYIASHFQVGLENVAQMGESFFCHVGVTPQRIYPFAMTAPAGGSSGPTGLTEYAPITNLWMLCYNDVSTSFMKVMSMAYKNLGESSDLSASWDFGRKLADHHERPVIAHSTDMRGLSGGSGGKKSGDEGSGGDASGSTGELAASLPVEDNAEKKQKAESRKPLPK